MQVRMGLPRTRIIKDVQTMHVMHAPVPAARLTAHRAGALGFWFLVCNAATQLATPLHQRRIQMVRSDKVALAAWISWNLQDV